MKRIAVDVRPLVYPGTGNATYLHRMLKELLASRPEDDWLFVAHRGVAPEFTDILQRSNVEINVDRGLASRTGPGWMHLRLPAILRENDIDLFWATLAMLPMRSRSRIDSPVMVNFHDLNAFRAPQTMVRWNRWQHRLLDRSTLDAADRVLCLSETTKADIKAQFPDYPEDRLRVVYPGCEISAPVEQPPRGPVAALDDFLLCVGTLEPRKNQRTVLRGYLRACEQRDDLLPLVFLGRKGWGDDSLYTELKSGQHEARGVFYIENPGDAELGWAYTRARFLILASLHEGFGLPVVEGFARGVPAILSDIPIFREIGGASRFVPVTEVESWAEAIKEASQAEPDSPAFDAQFWSWRSRAEHLSRIIDEL